MLNTKTFRIAFIDKAFEYPHREPFAKDYLQHLYDYSYRLAVGGYPWLDALPN